MELNKLTEEVKKAKERYERDFPEVKVDRDYFPFKITEEWGECLQTYLMLTDRGRQKGKSKEEIQELFRDEFADVVGFLLLFADREGIDPEEALKKKWFKYAE
ncbi:MAG: pyrophosphatase [Patescibacteria group bacterium]|mgnify:CR=1 FL=1